MYPGGILQKKENRNQNEMLQMFPDSDGIMYVYMSYSFVKKVAIGGMGTAGIRAYCFRFYSIGGNSYIYLF